jgi:hypothetical protein
MGKAKLTVRTLTSFKHQASSIKQATSNKQQATSNKLQRHKLRQSAK